MLERREEFAESLVEALEDVGLARTIDAGRAEESVDRDEIMAILDREPRMYGLSAPSPKT